MEDADSPCKNKSCVRRGPMEEKLLAKWEQVKTELATKIKGVQKLRRSVRKTNSRAAGRSAGGAGQRDFASMEAGIARENKGVIARLTRPKGEGGERDKRKRRVREKVREGADRDGLPSTGMISVALKRFVEVLFFPMFP